MVTQTRLESLWDISQSRRNISYLSLFAQFTSFDERSAITALHYCLALLSLGSCGNMTEIFSASAISRSSLLLKNERGILRYGHGTTLHLAGAVPIGIEVSTNALIRTGILLILHITLWLLLRAAGERLGRLLMIHHSECLRITWKVT